MAAILSPDVTIASSTSAGGDVSASSTRQEGAGAML